MNKLLTFHCRIKRSLFKDKLGSGLSWLTFVFNAFRERVLVSGVFLYVGL